MDYEETIADKGEEYIRDVTDHDDLSECCGWPIIMGRCSDCKEGV